MCNHYKDEQTEHCDISYCKVENTHEILKSDSNKLPKLLHIFYHLSFTKSAFGL